MADAAPQTESPATPFPSRADAIALGTFLLTLGAALAYWFRHDAWLAEYDIMSFFLPWFGHVGDRLRAGDIPGWMPWLSSGSPVAGDPSGGWWYLPVMLTFSVFHAATAFKAMILLQTVVAGLATYALARLVGLRPASALVATAAYALGPVLASQVRFGTVAGQASTWVPVALLGVECALRTSRPAARIAWWGLSGLAISQVAVSWPGQGLYSVLLFIAGWVAWRGLAWPVHPGRSWRGRWIDTLTTGPAVLVFGLLLGAAGLLPRLQVNSDSNIPGGDYTGIVGGNYLATPHSLATLLRDTLQEDPVHRPVSLAAPVVILALLALLLGRHRYGIPYFATVVLVGGILTMGDTPLHQLAYLLPEFEVIHDHSPRRLVWPLFLAPAMLAGAGVEAVLAWRPQRRQVPMLALPLMVFAIVALYLDRHDTWIGWWPVALALSSTALVALVVAGRGIPHLTRLATVAIILLVLGFPAGYDVARLLRADHAGREAQLGSCLETFLARTAPGGAGAFLQAQAASGEPFRYVAYAGRDPATRDASYSARRCDPAVLDTLAGGRAVRLELETIQGYNPLRLAVYAAYTEAMNGGPQDYHWMDPYPAILSGSPLLDMLNVRYIVVARGDAVDPAVATTIARAHVEVYRDASVVIYENTDAFPRAWIVHQVQQDMGEQSLAQLADGTIDGQTVAVINGPLPAVAAPGGPESVTITGQEEDRLTARANATAPGVVVFSEIHAEGWVATVNGEQVDVVQVNHALRGVPVPAGEHVIELRYEPASLRIGLWLSGLTGISLLAVGMIAVAGRNRPQHQSQQPVQGRGGGSPAWPQM